MSSDTGATTAPEAIRLREGPRRRRIGITRPEGQAQELAGLIADMGGEPVLLPLIRIRPPADWRLVDAAIRRASEFDWIVFTSVNGVRLWTERMTGLLGSLDALSGRKIAVIGPATADALRQRGAPVDLVPDAYVAESLLAALLDRIEPGTSILLPRAEEAREMLSDGLRQAGMEVCDVPMYSTDLASDEVREQLRRELASGALDVLTLTSSSTARSLAAIVADSPDLLRHTALVSIGPITSGTARALGLRIAAEAREHTTRGLVAAIESWLREDGCMESEGRDEGG